MTGTGVDFYVDGLAGRRKLVQRSNLRMQEFAIDLIVISVRSQYQLSSFPPGEFQRYERGRNACPIR